MVDFRKSGYLVQMLNTVDVAYSSNSTFGRQAEFNG